MGTALTPFEERLRRVYRLRAFGHEPTAPNCFWCQPEWSDNAADVREYAIAQANR